MLVQGTCCSNNTSMYVGPFGSLPFSREHLMSEQGEPVAQREARPGWPHTFKNETGVWVSQGKRMLALAVCPTSRSFGFKGFIGQHRFLRGFKPQLFYHI